MADTMTGVQNPELRRIIEAERQAPMNAQAGQFNNQNKFMEFLRRQAIQPDLRLMQLQAQQAQDQALLAAAQGVNSRPAVAQNALVAQQQALAPQMAQQGISQLANAQGAYQRNVQNLQQYHRGLVRGAQGMTTNRDAQDDRRRSRAFGNLGGAVSTAASLYSSSDKQSKKDVKPAAKFMDNVPPKSNPHGDFDKIMKLQQELNERMKALEARKGK